MGPVTVSGAGVNYLDDIQQFLHGIGLNGGSGYDRIIIKAVINHKYSFPILYRNEFHFTSMDKVQETFRKVSKYSFYIWGSQAMRVIGKKQHVSTRENI